MVDDQTAPAAAEAPRTAEMTRDDPATADAGPAFPRAKGMNYRSFLGVLHERMLFDWYMEIGCRAGRTFASVRSPTVAVDPFFRIHTDVIGAKPALHLFQTTSDDFFDGGVLGRLGIRPSFSFLDGMHLFEFLLRDFLNTEVHSVPGGVIALHDCVPFGAPMTTRDLDNLPKGAWTGDVWKLIPILQEYRPDLRLTVLDCAPTGLVLVSGLDPENRILRAGYDEILTKYAGGIEDFGVARFRESFSLVPVAEYIAADFPDFVAVRRDPEASPVRQPVSP